MLNERMLPGQGEWEVADSIRSPNSIAKMTTKARVAVKQQRDINSFCRYLNALLWISTECEMSIREILVGSSRKKVSAMILNQ